MEREEPLDVHLDPPGTWVHATQGELMPEIKTPLCPLCGQPPALIVFDRQWFCGNEECKTLCWDPTMGPEQLENVSFVDLSQSTEEEK
jgi:hypothetical protein